TSTLIECLDMCDFMLAHVRINPDIISDPRYDYLFTVEDVNRMVLDGTPFREAYRAVGHAVADGTYHPTRSVHHTHIGSIGNLANDAIAEKMSAVMKNFD
ncbi:MAG: argininosuccinate lyase, partial [Muribaculaceae bacterium]|nr:argininosuccinate lyase [Muribaculaceae bacterium]